MSGQRRQAEKCVRKGEALIRTRYHSRCCHWLLGRHPVSHDHVDPVVILCTSLGVLVISIR